MLSAEQKQPAHELVDRLDAGQLDAVVRLPEVMADPRRKIAQLPQSHFRIAPATAVTK